VGNAEHELTSADVLGAEGLLLLSNALLSLLGSLGGIVSVRVSRKNARSLATQLWSDENEITTARTM